MSATSELGAGHAFDLNIERVLEHWPVANSVREFIANALDEHELTGSPPPGIVKIADGEWCIRDFGRGVHYEHLTQNENPEKLDHPRVIGQFGIGLKDALAVCHRRGVEVVVRSRHGEIRTSMRAKAGFPDVVTLHAVVAASPDDSMVGTEVLLRGAADEDVEQAKAFFLRYSGDEALEQTKYGDVLLRPEGSTTGRIYVKGLLVAEEPNFLFSYNVTQLNASLRRALNRERSNVGRSAYSDRVKDILKAASSSEVAEPLARDLAGFVSGRLHDELSWKDVAVHACRIVQTVRKVVFVTPWQLPLASVEYARQDGYEPIVVPEDIARALRGVTDLRGAPMLDLGAFQREWNDSFDFQFVGPYEMTTAERTTYALVEPVVRLLEIDLRRVGVEEVLVSETMRLNEQGAEVLGLFEPEDRRIVIRRDQLGDVAAFLGTLLHEVEHAASGFRDGTLEFEEALTRRLGAVASLAVAAVEATTRRT